MGGAERVETAGAQATERLAARVARDLRPGDVVLISGDLGSGKTTFVRGACRALGVRGRVTSPTFTIARRYEDGDVPISHLDLYRLAGEETPDAALLEDEAGPGRITFVEWPEAQPEALNGARIAARVHLEHGGGDVRVVTLRTEHTS